MRKRHNIALILFFVFVFTSTFSNISFGAGNYTELPSKNNVELNKSWNIKFSFDVDSSCVTDDHQIILLDENNEYVSIQRQLVNSKQVKITPTYGYEYGKNYTLIIRNTVKSTQNVRLSNEIRMRFNTVDKPSTPSRGDDTTQSNLKYDYVVTLDAGRAANDVGNEVGPTGVKGKDINLSVALKAGEILENAGIKVVYTRKTDSVSWSASESIAARSKIVNDNNSDVLVSIHTNSWSTTASGPETYYLESSSEGKKLAGYIQGELVEETGLNNRGITPYELKTLNTVDAVAIYTNIGFISNPTEEKKLASASFQESAAKAIADGVMEYLDVSSFASIKSVDDINVILNKGEQYSLPSTVKALMSDNSEKNVNISWDKSTVDSSKTGTYYFNGTVQGYSGTVKLKVVVNDTNPNVGTVCIDAARGGDVNGAVGTSGLKEKDVNLSVALKLGDILESKGINVVYTRTGDNVSWDNTNSTTDISNRTKVANDANADVFVSIHVNNAATSTAKGVETYYLEGDTLSNSIADSVQKSVISATGANDRGIKSSTYQTLSGLDGTGIFVYLGFMTNATDQANLGSSAYQQKCAQGIADALLQVEGLEGGQQVEEEFFTEFPIDDVNAVSNVEDFTLVVDQGESFTLPKYVVVTNSKGQKVRTSVIWDSGSVNTNEAGLKIVTGRTKNSWKQVVMAVEVIATNKKNVKVAIDAGHGGYDPGAIGPSGVKEKDVVLSVSLKTADNLIKNGVEVVFTRISDNVPWPSSKSAELAMRCDISNDANVDYFISIHANSMGSTSSITGVETFYYYGRTDSAQFANNVNESLYTSIDSVNRGVKERGFYVNRYVDAPSILTELEFLSNSTKEQLLKTDSFQQKCADAISSGILKTIN